MKVWIVCGLLLVLFLGSCSSWQDVTVTKVEQFHVLKLDPSGIVADLDLKIKNPNWLGFTIYDTDLDLKLNGNKVGKITLKDKVHINPHSEEAYTFVIASQFDKVLSGGGGLMGLLSMAMTNSANIGVAGTLHAGKFLYRKKFKIDVSQKVPLTK